ncbi:hypothetical protein RJT34_28699 [Clitoria ternatea]|uniref:BZIP domain-containing protein n=1 Tax=Clitoria ternatea TaxID=43366 RepID=A0AAN9FBB3_CLITE
MAFQQSEQEVQLQETESTFFQMNKQNSASLSLTLDEFQCKSGKTYGSLNMDEFLASIWSSDDNQVNPPQAHTQHEASSQGKSVATEPISVPPPICMKTVDEVWSQIQKNQPQHNETNNNLGRNETLKKQPTLGEMTLEDFLVKAGVVQQSSSSRPKTSNVSSNASYGLRPTLKNNVSSNGLETHQMLSHNNSLVVKDSTTCHAAEKCQSLSESSGVDGNRKRIIDGPLELVIERRQRRMLKNRESAARSRARKQAYTIELEAELDVLKQENEKLKQTLVDNIFKLKIHAESEAKRKQEICQRKQSTTAQKRTEKLRAMGKTLSAAW